MSPSPGALWWFFVMVALALVVILTAFASALIVYQRRFLRAHRTFADNLLAAHEEERAWVAREVHDDALQRVAMLVHELDEWPAPGVAHCRMHIAVSPDRIEMLVQDQGRGFVADDSARGRGLGLISMAERARLADGRLEIWSRPGEGTSVRAMIPRQ